MRSVAWSSVAIVLPSCGRQCAFHENEVNTQKEATGVDIQRKAEMTDHTLILTHIPKQKGEGSLEE